MLSTRSYCLSDEEACFLQAYFPQVFARLEERMSRVGGYCYLPASACLPRQFARAGAGAEARAQLQLYFAKHRVVKPADCRLLLGIPSTMQEYARGRSDYAKNTPAKAYSDFLRYLLLPHLEEIRSCGVHIGGAVSFAEFRNWLNRQPRVLLFFSHWQLGTELNGFAGGKLEFLDGLIPAADVAAAVLESEYSGTLDLGVCHPDELFRLLNRGRSACSFHYLRARQAKPAVALQYFSDILTCLSRQKLHYLLAIHEVLKIYQQRNEEKK